MRQQPAVAGRVHRTVLWVRAVKAVGQVMGIGEAGVPCSRPAQQLPPTRKPVGWHTSCSTSFRFLHLSDLS